jgi:hypothetical protein
VLKWGVVFVERTILVIFLRLLELGNEVVEMFACDVGDLAALPGNRFENLKGGCNGQCSIRINDQWRIVRQQNTPIVVYCASGEHCTSAIQVLRDLGI